MTVSPHIQYETNIIGSKTCMKNGILYLRKMLLQINYYSRSKCIPTAVPNSTGVKKLATNFVIQIKEDTITECINE